MDNKKIHEVCEKFFASLKSKENEVLETGLTQNQTVDALHLAVLNAIEGNEDKFEIYVKWFLSSSMYLLDENEEFEDIAICGAKGSGKSYLANTLLQSLHGINVFCWDYNSQFHDSRSMVFHNLDEMIEVWKTAKRGKYILQDYNLSEENFRKFCKFAFNTGNCVVVIDEVHAYVTKQKILKEYNDIILSGRPRGISCVSISTRPASLPNNVLTNAKHVFTFRLNLESDVKFLEGWLGAEVWQVVQKNKRMKHQDLPEVPEHSFYYRNMDESEGYIGKI